LLCFLNKKRKKKIGAFMMEKFGTFYQFSNDRISITHYVNLILYSKSHFDSNKSKKRSNRKKNTPYKGVLKTNIKNRKDKKKIKENRKKEKKNL